MSNKRYQVVKGSQSAHCCFEATIVDTTKPVVIGGKPYPNQYEEMCECFETHHAKLICDALNAYQLSK
jgi:uracil DNA glycosylase